MYLRSAQYKTATALHKKHDQLEAGALGRVSFGGKRLLLWLLLSLQLCFICGFCMLQLSQNTNNTTTTRIIGSTSRAAAAAAADWNSNERVNFITKLLSSNNNARTKAITNDFTTKTNNFAKDFYAANKRLNNNNKNETADNNDVQTIWCFSEGSINASMLHMELGQEETQCKCRAGWHGRDCAQPEIIWRALMTDKSQLMLQTPKPTVKQRKLIYFLEGHFFSLDMLELQLHALIEVVDYFIIFVKQKQVRILQRHLKQLLQLRSYAVIQCLHLPTGNCSTAAALKYWLENKAQQLPWQLQADGDLCLHTHEREILLPQAFKYLKYYAAQLPVLHFRLKHNVYGFYWQHPMQTKLSGSLSSLAQLKQQLLHNNTNSRANTLVLGDLNHFAGWYCEYCQQTEEIIAELHATTSSLQQLVKFPHNTRDRHIDSNYLQHLIADGIYLLDAETQLLRIRSQSDAYYAPNYAQEHSWKFGQLLTNLYETLYEDIDDFN